MKSRPRNTSRDALREELGPQAGVSSVMGAYSELPESYLESPGGLCAGHRPQRRSSGSGDRGSLNLNAQDLEATPLREQQKGVRECSGRFLRRRS